MARKSQPPAFSAHISRDTAAKAVDALLKWIRSQPKYQKAQLLEHDEVIHLVVTMCKIPEKARVNPYYLPLPYPLHSLPDATTCLFIDDRAKSPVQPSDVEARIRSESIPVTDVITVGSLKTDYIPYESRRKLCGSYELFFADRRIIHLLPRLIGKQFFKKKKHPLPVDLSHKNWEEQLTRRCSSALLYMGTGTCCQLNIGRLSMKRDDIVDNIIAAVEGAVEKIPKGWSNVRSILIKSDDSVGLPLYQALPGMGLRIDVPLKEEVNNVDTEAIADADGGLDSNSIVVDQVTAADEVVKVSSAKKSASKKGKLHKVLYMDTNLEERDSIIDLSRATNDDHPLGSIDAESDREITTTLKKRKQNDKKGNSDFSSILGSGEKSQGKKKSAGKKKLKTQQLDDRTADEEVNELTGQKSQEKKRKLTLSMNAEQVEDATVHEGSEELIGDKSQKGKERQGKKFKKQLVDETADEKQQSGTAKKTKSKQSNISDIDGSVHDASEELFGDKSQAGKERSGKKIKKQLVDGTADKEPQSGTAKKTKNKNSNIFDIEDSVREGSEDLIGDKSQTGKERSAKKIKKQLVDGTAEKEPQSGTAKKTKNKQSIPFDIDGSVDDSDLFTPKSNGRKKREEKKNQQEEKTKGPETAEKETPSKTAGALSSVKKRKDTNKKLTNMEGSEKKTKKSQV